MKKNAQIKIVFPEVCRGLVAGYKTPFEHFFSLGVQGKIFYFDLKTALEKVGVDIQYLPLSNTIFVIDEIKNEGWLVRVKNQPKKSKFYVSFAMAEYLVPLPKEAKKKKVQFFLEPYVD